MLSIMIALFLVDGAWHDVITMCPQTQDPMVAIGTVVISNPNATQTFVASRLIDDRGWILVRGGGRNIGRDIGHHETLRTMGYLDPPDEAAACYTLQVRTGASPRPDIKKPLKVELGTGLFFIRADSVPADVVARDR